MKSTHYTTYWINPDDLKTYHETIEIVESWKFYSTGKNGNFEQRILITRYRNSLDANSFNLGFGVWNELSEDIDDQIETRNDDAQIILATVGKKAVDFLRKYPNAELFAEGSTRSRTRLYQREIGKVIDQIPAELRIEGLIRSDDIGFVAFEKGLNFDAFLLSAK